MLIGIKSCERDRERGAHQLVRDVWGHEAPLSGVDVKFFTARSGVADSDEVIVDAPDDYVGLRHKTREICRWALSHEYTQLFLCDTGSLMFPHRLVNYEWGADYVGYCRFKEPREYELKGPTNGEGLVMYPSVVINPCYPWASGPGYFLSARAMKIVANNDPHLWAEDVWVGQVLARNEIFLVIRDEGFKGHVVDWDPTEHVYNDRGDAMVRRQRWMKHQKSISNPSPVGG